MAAVGALAYKAYNDWQAGKQAAPVGFYFAKLWYFERLYPQLATVTGLGAAVKHLPPDTE